MPLVFVTAVHKAQDGCHGHMFNIFTIMKLKELTRKALPALFLAVLLTLIVVSFGDENKTLIVVSFGDENKTEKKFVVATAPKTPGEMSKGNELEQQIKHLVGGVGVEGSHSMGKDRGFKPDRETIQHESTEGADIRTSISPPPFLVDLPQQPQYCDYCGEGDIGESDRVLCREICGGWGWDNIKPKALSNATASLPRISPEPWWNISFSPHLDHAVLPPLDGRYVAVMVVGEAFRSGRGRKGCSAVEAMGVGIDGQAEVTRSVLSKMRSAKTNLVLSADFRLL
jgi:hypothetical protein